MNFTISLVISIIFILVPAYYTFQNDKDKKHYKTVFVFSMIGLVLVIINALLSNAESKRNEKIAIRNDSLYKSQLNKNLKNSEKIIKSLTAQIRSSQKLLQGSDQMLTKQNESSLLLAQQLSETDQLLIDNKQNLKNTSLTLRQFDRNNTKFDDILVELQVEYSLEDYTTRKSLSSAINKIQKTLNHLQNLDSLTLANFFIDHKANGNRVKLGQSFWQFDDSTQPRYQGYKVKTFLYKDLIIERLVKDNDSLFYSYIISGHPPHIPVVADEFNTGLLHVFPTISITPYLQRIDTRGWSQRQIDQSSNVKTIQSYKDNNLEYEIDQTEDLQPLTIQAKSQRYNFVENKGLGIYKIPMKRTKFDPSIIGVVDLEGRYLKINLHAGFLGFSSKDRITGIRAKCSIKSLVINYGDGFLRKYNVPISSIIEGSFGEIVFKL